MDLSESFTGHCTCILTGPTLYDELMLIFLL
uniref:Uncharacterized protein n=1 Tax=Arundo donax TaxID=35708 RepID=A0A0A8ZB59_ARUDO